METIWRWSRWRSCICRTCGSRGGYQFSAEPMNTTGEVVFEDNFERTELGPQYRQGKPDLGHPQNEWRIEDFCAIRNNDAGPKRTRRAFKEMVSFGLTLEFDLWCNRRLVGENIHNAALWLKEGIARAPARRIHRGSVVQRWRCQNRDFW